MLSRFLHSFRWALQPVKHISSRRFARLSSHLLCNATVPVQFHLAVPLSRLTGNWQVTTTICNNLWNFCTRARQFPNRSEAEKRQESKDSKSRICFGFGFGFLCALLIVAIGAVTLWLRNWCVYFVTRTSFSINQISQKRRQLFFSGHPWRDTCRIHPKSLPQIATFIAQHANRQCQCWTTLKKIQTSVVQGINFYDKLIKHKFRTLKIEIWPLWERLAGTSKAKAAAILLSSCAWRAVATAPVPGPSPTHVSRTRAYYLHAIISFFSSFLWLHSIVLTRYWFCDAATAFFVCLETPCGWRRFCFRLASVSVVIHQKRLVLVWFLPPNMFT